METVEEIMVNVTSSMQIDPENCEISTKDAEMGSCQKTNGIAESTDTQPLDDTTVTIGQVNNATENESVSDTNSTTAECGNSNLKPKSNENEITSSDINVYEEDPCSANVEEKDDSDSIVAHVIEIAESTTNLSNVDTVSDNVTFETEILVEKSDDTNENKSAEHEKTNNILNELGQNIGLSEALCSSESVETAENNNSHNKHQVLNNEELLDILEGNDDIYMSETVIAIDHPDAKSLETQLALQQLSRLKIKKRKNTRTLVSPTIEKHINHNMGIKFEEDLLPSEDNLEKTIKSKKKVSSEDVSLETHINDDTKSHKNEDNLKYPEKETDTVDHIVRQKKEDKNLETNKAKLSVLEKLPKASNGNSKIELKIDNSKEHKKNKKKDNIVNALVQDWDDDEAMEEESRDTSHEIPTDENTNELDISQEDVLNKETISKGSVDSCSSPTNQERSENTSKEDKDCQSQKRQSRVIKKKVIFDPDNPDTFTKTKAVSKNKEIETEHQPAKKIKVDPSLQKSSLKSPTSKLKWKKPSAAKSNKQNKRLSEVDRLLMDEGAVNMIYQLTPEAPKGKKNVRTKAEFIKKLQSSTPDGKEMKFRERKKENKEEDEAKRIVGGKKRMSLSSSVKSPSACEDFETHSADDSIIYRRHSSSSYSSTGMSPRRPSEVDSNASQNTIAYQKSSILSQLDKDADNSDVFMSEITDTSTNEIIKKEDCVSLKEKLNSKLAQALKTKKHDSVKNEKPSKRKKNPKPEDQPKSSHGYTMKYESLTITVSNRLAEICIRKTGTKKHYNIETLKELDNALEYIDNKKDISITLVTSQCGSLCSDIDLRHLLVDNKEKKINSANEIAEAVRSLLCRMEQHNKLLCTGVWGACSGVGLAMVALSDMVIASEHATFSVGSQTVFGQTPPLPGIAVLTMQQRWSQSLVNDLVVSGRRLAASEALRAGLVSRVLWPNRFLEQLRAMVNDIAAQPPQSLLLKKQLLRINKSPESKTTFLTSMEAERDMLAEYWTSFEGQEMLRTYYD